MSTATPTQTLVGPPDVQLQRMSVGILHRWMGDNNLSPIATRRLLQRRETLMMHQLQLKEREAANIKLRQIQDKLIYMQTIQQVFPSRVSLEIDALLLFVKQKEPALPPPFASMGGASR